MCYNHFRGCMGWTKGEIEYHANDEKLCKLRLKSLNSYTVKLHTKRTNELILISKKVHTDLSILVPLFIIHKSQIDLAIKLPATNTRRPASVDDQPGTTIFTSSDNCLKNCLSTCAFTVGSFFSAIMYLTSSSCVFAFRFLQNKLPYLSLIGIWQIEVINANFEVKLTLSKRWNLNIFSSVKPILMWLRSPWRSRYFSSRICCSLVPLLLFSGKKIAFLEGTTHLSHIINVICYWFWLVTGWNVWGNESSLAQTEPNVTQRLGTFLLSARLLSTLDDASGKV